MPWGSAIAAGAAVVGSSMQADAAGDAAAMQAQSAKDAAAESRFRPVGVTSRFGSSNFGYTIPGVVAPARGDYNTDEEFNKANAEYQTRLQTEGRLSSAGYTLDPQMAAMRDKFLSQAEGRGMQTADQGYEASQGLFNLGKGYLAQSPEQAAQQWMAAQQAALAPGRERAYAGMLNRNFNQGTTGLAVGATGADGGSMRASNPLADSYFNSIAQQDLGLAAQAQEQGRAQTAFGSGLLSDSFKLQNSAYAPYSTQLGLGKTIEDYGASTLDMGAQLGGRTASAGATAGNYMMQGANAMAGAAGSPMGSALMGLSQNSQFTKGLGDALSGMFSSAQPYDMYSNSANSGLMSAFGNNTSGAWNDSSYTSNPLRAGM